MEFASLTLAAAFVQKLIEKLRGQFPIIDGPYVNLAAYGLGMVLAFGFSLEVFSSIGFTGPAWLDRGLTGFGLGAGSGFLADFSGRSGPRSDTTISLPYTVNTE